MKRHHPERMRREFSVLHQSLISKNYLKNLCLILDEFQKKYGIRRVDMEFMLFAYEYEFFTVTFIAKKLGRSRNKLYERTILKLKQEGYLEIVHSAKDVDGYVYALFKEVKDKNTNRLTLSHKGRLAVQRFYRRLEGEEANHGA